MSKEPSKKSVRVALTKSQAAEGLGLELVQLAARWLQDGRFSEDELAELRNWLDRCPAQSIPAIAFIREEVQRYVEDGVVADWELDRLFAALARVIPPDQRKLAKDARAGVAAQRYEARAPEREAARKANAEYWRGRREQFAEIWAKEAATEAQLDFIRELGGSGYEGMSKLDASYAIDRLLGNGAAKPLSIPGWVGFALGALIVLFFVFFFGSR